MQRQHRQHRTSRNESTSMTAPQPRLQPPPPSTQAEQRRPSQRSDRGEKEVG